MPEKFALKPIGKQKRRKNDELSNIHLPDGLLEVERFSVSLEANTISKKPKKVNRTYIIELHRYQGFAMVKYHPRARKNHPNKYQLRSKELGYKLTYPSIKALLRHSILIMKEYLDQSPTCFIGYVGQPDKYDDEKVHNKTAQRARVYNRYVISMFQSDKYAFPQDELFTALNLNFVRKVEELENQISPAQLSNFDLLRQSLASHEEELYNFMTSETRKAYR